MSAPEPHVKYEPHLNLRHLRAFYEVGRLGHISPVSELVFMSQPAISQAMVLFETRCDASLFDRSSSALSLTEAGRLMHERAGRALALLEQGTKQAVHRRGQGERLARHMTMTQLRALVAVADCGGITAAARVLKTSQPALSRTMGAFQTLCGRDLLDKTGRGVALTTAGAVLARAARLAFAEIRQGMDEIKALLGADTSVLTVGALPLVRSVVLPRAIVGFAAQEKQIEIRVVDGPYGDLLAGLQRGEIDLIIGALRQPAPVEDVVEQRLFDDTLSIIARGGHPLAQSGPICPEDLQSYPWIVPRAGTPTRDAFNQMVAGLWGGKPPSVIEASSLILMRGILVDSDSLSLVSAQQVAFELATGVVSQLNFAVNDRPRPIGITYRKGWKPTQSQSVFLQILKGLSMR